ncbi:hypothetical protein C8N26_0738 [Tenacibaculum lutimaris]|uniref:Parallel beta helix pectate lyase-like protein n=1 Tax=Tenacibaculum lutimaris TaxID=285258 RepID=A0A420E1Y5_9FLAO|nr:hypothetical protein [Tenacibaculum lutimaris]RKF04079.1 hypothetical protein C8N26_0738 [Tenacibaculum lutimaris]
MKTIKLLSILAISASLMVGCSDDDPVTPPSEGFDLEINGQDDFDPKDLKGNVNADITLKAGVEYLLTSYLRVKDGKTLTIEPGTTIKCKAGGTDVFLAVERGAKINAAGTQANPIIFTSDASNPRPGDWGGIVIAGKAKTNKGAEAETEVGGLNYGGTQDDDNSGTLTYVKTEYTGAKINGDQEFNGVSLYTVGSQTTINNLFISNGADDGIEFFGGTVDVQNVICINIKDDMFDFTEGYSGTMDNMFGVRENGFNDATEDPRGIEGDSNGSNPAAAPVSTPTIKNVTVLNLSEITPLKAGAEIRRGTVATIDNALFAAYGGASFGNLIDTQDSSGDGTLTITNSYKMGTVGENKEGGTITGTVTEDVEAITADGDNLTVKAGLGADFTAFSWTGYTLKK